MMKTIYVKKGPLGMAGPWLVSKDGHPLEVEDDVKAPIGSVWDGDYRSGRPTFTKPRKAK
jgi:hypothetical protein